MTDNKIAIMRKHSDNIMRYGDTIYELDKDIANTKDELTELLNDRSNQKRVTNEAYQAQDRILAVELQDMLTKYTPEKIFATQKLQIAVFGCEMNVELDDDTTVEDIVKDTRISPIGMAMFIMHFVEGTSTADIADSLGLLPHRVNKQIHKVLTKIVDGKIKRLVYVSKNDEVAQVCGNCVHYIPSTEFELESYDCGANEAGQSVVSFPPRTFGCNKFVGRDNA